MYDVKFRLTSFTGFRKRTARKGETLKREKAWRENVCVKYETSTYNLYFLKLKEFLSFCYTLSCPKKRRMHSASVYYVCLFLLWELCGDDDVAKSCYVYVDAKKSFIWKITHAMHLICPTKDEFNLRCITTFEDILNAEGTRVKLTK